jgi:hypothetical protein
MMAPAKPTHLDFLAMLPTIQQQADFLFRDLPRERREEAVQEVVASSFIAFVRLATLGRVHLAFASALARYGAAQVRVGRYVAERLNANEILSRRAQRQKGFRVERLDQFDKTEGKWKEIVVEDRNATPAEAAATRIDVADWLNSLSSRNRCLAETLATGETTQDAAAKFRITPGRVSQLRQKLREAWHRFQGEPAPLAAATT